MKHFIDKYATCRQNGQSNVMKTCLKHTLFDMILRFKSKNEIVKIERIFSVVFFSVFKWEVFCQTLSFNHLELKCVIFGFYDTFNWLRFSPTASHFRRKWTKTRNSDIGILGNEFCFFFLVRRILNSSFADPNDFVDFHMENGCNLKYPKAIGWKTRKCKVVKIWNWVPKSNIVRCSCSGT